MSKELRWILLKTARLESCTFNAFPAKAGTHGPAHSLPKDGPRPAPGMRDFCLQLPEHRLGVGDREFARLFDVERLDDAVVDQHRIALRANPHAFLDAVE